MIGVRYARLTPQEIEAEVQLIGPRGTTLGLLSIQVQYDADPEAKRLAQDLEALLEKHAHAILARAAQP